MFQRSSLPALPFAAYFRSDAGRRTLSLGLTLLIEALLVLLVLTLGRVTLPVVEVRQPPMTTIEIREVAAQAAADRRPERQQRTQAQSETQQPQPDQPQPRQPAAPAVTPATPPAPPAPAIIPMRFSLAPANPLRRLAPTPPARPVYGPANNPSVMFRDTERVGTAPNGQPLYAAEWYREPEDAMMRAYLSSAQPGYALIACRTASGYRVEDCVGLSEYPEGSQMLRSVLAMAWEFRVRPPRRGGQVLVGSWVRIRISYEIGGRR